MLKYIFKFFFSNPTLFSPLGILIAVIMIPLLIPELNSKQHGNGMAASLLLSGLFFLVVCVFIDRIAVHFIGNKIITFIEIGILIVLAGTFIFS